MKGIILAAGHGKRLLPFTSVVPKALLPVKKNFLIDFSLKLFDSVGIQDVCVVISPNHATAFATALGSSRNFPYGSHGLDLTYRIQTEPKGIAHALSTCERWAAGEQVLVALADTIFIPYTHPPFHEGATCFSYKVENPYWCGCVERDDVGKVLNLVEKPGEGYNKSKEVLIGLYAYDNSVFDRIRELKPSERGELEITDLNLHYLKSGDLHVESFNGFWHDAGTDLNAYLGAWK